MCRKTLIFAIFCICFSCARSGAPGSVTSLGVISRVFPVTDIPSVYTDRALRAEWAAEHYWDAFLSDTVGFACDSATVYGVDLKELEQQFSNYISLLEALDISFGRKAMASLFEKIESAQKADASSNVFETFASLTRKYLYDPNSPLRCEDLYLPYVSALASSAFSDPLLKPSYASEASNCSLNKIGDRAADFVFRDINGRDRNLYSIKSRVCLLFFSNPGCEACKSIMEELKASPLVESALSDGLLAVVNVYIDEDIAAWKKYQDYYPDSWYNGYDPTYSIRQDLSYNVRAIPSVYLLDEEKKVILKDAPETRVLELLNNILKFEIK